MCKSFARRTALSSCVAISALAFAIVGSACQRDTKGPTRNDPTAHALQAQPSRASGKVVSVPVGGMICMVCAGSVKNALKAVHGVQSADVSLEKHQATVEYDADTVSVDELARTISKLGYKAGIPAPLQRQ